MVWYSFELSRADNSNEGHNIGLSSIVVTAIFTWNAKKIEYSKCCLICETNSMVWPLFWAVLNRRFKWGSQQRGRFWIKKAIMSTVYIIAVSICLFPNLGMMEFDLLIQIKSAFEPVCKCYFTKCSLLYKKVKQYSSVPLCFDKTWPLISQRLAPVTKACWK